MVYLGYLAVPINSTVIPPHTIRFGLLCNVLILHEKRMLRVFMVSGEEFATHIGGDLNDVRSLKRHLWKTRGVSRFRQKLLYNGVVLDDHTTLDQPLDLQLVLMSFVKVGRLQLEAFSEAFASGHVQQVEEMLHRLHDPNQRDRKRQCPLPLLEAAEKGHAEVVRLLLEACADKEAFRQNETSLRIASARGHVEVVHVLLEVGADPNLEQQGVHFLHQALHGAAAQGYFDIAKLLLKSGAEKDRDTYEGTPLCLASSGGHVDIVTLLLGAGADKNKTSLHVQPRTPLCRAAGNGHAKIVQLLLQAGADKDAETPLGHASAAGHLDIVRMLLAARCDLHPCDAFGKMPLLAASEGGHPHVVKELLLHPCWKLLSASCLCVETIMLPTQLPSQKKFQERLDAGASTDGVLPDPTTGIGSHRVLHDPAILTLLLDAAARAGKVDLQNLPLLYRTKSSKA